jgi:hypothetical protein
MFELPSWIGVRGSLTPVVAQPNYPVKKAYRTAGIVRGKYPYALVVDDIQKDDAVHHYDWILVLQPDLQIVRIDGLDVLLTGDPEAQPKKDESLPPVRAEGPVKAGQPMLLVRLLSRDGKADDKPPALIDELKEKRNTIRRLVLPADAVAPGYKVLLYAYKEGDALPKTAWNDRRDRVTIEWPGQVDTVAFAPAPCGKTNLAVTRGGNGAAQELVRIEKDATPLPGPASEAAPK